MRLIKGSIYQSTTGISGKTKKRKMPPTGRSGLTATNGHFYEMNYHSMTAGTDRRKMRNLLHPAGLMGPVPLVYLYYKTQRLSVCSTTEAKGV